MTRSDTIRELAAYCRENERVALGVVGYCVALMGTGELEEALEFARELRREHIFPTGHLDLLEERYGRRPQ